jgi:hypothetical protein
MVGSGVYVVVSANMFVYSFSIRDETALNFKVYPTFRLVLPSSGLMTDFTTVLLDKMSEIKLLVDQQ